MRSKVTKPQGFVISGSAETIMTLIKLAIEACLDQEVLFRHRTATPNPSCLDGQRRFEVNGAVEAKDGTIHLFAMEIDVAGHPGGRWYVGGDFGKRCDGLYTLTLDGHDWKVGYCDQKEGQPFSWIPAVIVCDHPLATVGGKRFWARNISGRVMPLEKFPTVF